MTVTAICVAHLVLALSIIWQIAMFNVHAFLNDWKQGHGMAPIASKDQHQESYWFMGCAHLIQSLHRGYDIWLYSSKFWESSSLWKTHSMSHVGWKYFQNMPSQLFSPDCTLYLDAVLKSTTCLTCSWHTFINDLLCCETDWWWVGDAMSEKLQPLQKTLISGTQDFQAFGTASQIASLFAKIQGKNLTVLTH